jgi:hypothetical protein
MNDMLRILAEQAKKAMIEESTKSCEKMADDFLENVNKIPVIQRAFIMNMAQIIVEIRQRVKDARGSAEDYERRMELVDLSVMNYTGQALSDLRQLQYDLERIISVYEGE